MADVVDADLTGSYFQRVDLTEARFDRVNLSRAEIRGARVDVLQALQWPPRLGDAAETESGTRPGHCPTVPSVNASRKPATVASATQDPPSR